MADYIDGSGGGGRFGNLFNTMQRGIQSSIMKGSSSSSGSYYPNPAHTIKCGWLKKYGGTLRSWQRRWFTLKEDKTFYIFSSEDETRAPLNSIYLDSYRIIELAHTNEPEKFLFDLVPGDSPRVGASTFYMFDDNIGTSNGGGGTLERNRTAASNTDGTTYQLCAATDDDRKEWVKVLRRTIFAEKGGAIFGQSLELTLQYDKGGAGRKVPTIVEMCVDFVTKNGLEQEGIFRLPGRTSLIRSLKESFDSGEQVILDPTEIDIHSVASLLKLYLRELPAPLVPMQSYEAIIKIVTRDMSVNPDQALEDLVALVQSFREESYNILQYLCQFLHEISLHEDENKMSAMNLATCFVHAFIRPEEDDPALLMGTSNGRTQVTYALIVNFDKVFSKEYTEGSQRGAGNVDKSSLGDLVDLDFCGGASGDKTGNKTSPVMRGSVRRASSQTNQSSPRRPQQLGNTTEDLFSSLDDNRTSVCNLPMPLSPQQSQKNGGSSPAIRSSRQFEDKIQKGLSRTGSKRGAVIVDRESSSSERDLSGGRSMERELSVYHDACEDYANDDDDSFDSDEVEIDAEEAVEEEEEDKVAVVLPSPVSDHFAMTPLSPVAGGGGGFVSCDTSTDTYTSCGGTSESSPERRSILRKPPGTENPKKIPPMAPPRPGSRSMSQPSIPPRPQSVQIPAVPPRPRVKKTLSAQNLNPTAKINGTGSSSGGSTIHEHPDGASASTWSTEADQAQQLINTDTSAFSHDQLQAHVKSLCRELKSERADKEELKRNTEEMKQMHKKQLNNLAEKLDEAKMNIEQSVDKIMHLQMKITAYEMNYGQIAEY